MSTNLPLRILSVIETLGSVGGAERVLVDVVLELNSRGHHLEVAALYPPYDLAELLRERGIRVHTLNLGHRWSILQAILGLRRICPKGSFDVVSSHLFFARIYTAIALGGKKGILHTTTFHNQAYDSFPANTLYKRLRKGLDAWLIRNRVDCPVAVSKQSGKSYESHLGLGDVAIIPNCLRARWISDQKPQDPTVVRRRYGIDDADFLISVAGRLVPEKGHCYLVEALRLLAREDIRPKAILAGGGPLTEAVRAQILQSGLDRQIQLVGRLPQSESLALQAVADCCVLPSTHEGFGLAIAEAMILARPVIATRVGAMPEIIDDGRTGILVLPADPPALAEAIERILRNPELGRRLGYAARQGVMDRFDVSAVVSQWETFLRNRLLRKREGAQSI